MLSTSSLVALVLPCLVALHVAQAKDQSVYSFAEGKSSPDGLKHGARGFECLEKLHGGDLDFLKEIDEKEEGEEITDDHIAAALFMVYGKKGIDNVCRFTENFGNNNDSGRRSLLRSEATTATKSSSPHNTRKETTATHVNDEITNSQRRTSESSFTESACTAGAKANYPSRSDPAGVYSGFVSSRLQTLLPDGCSADCRLDQTKVVNEAQKPLDEAEEGEFSASLCATWFNGFATLASIPDFVVFKQKPILDGINQLSCGVARNAMQSVQGQIRSLMADGMKHNTLINEAEQAATYENSKLLADSLCSMGTRVLNVGAEIHKVKENIAAP